MSGKDMSFFATCVTKLLVKKEVHTPDVHAQLHQGYDNACMGASSVRQWVKHFKDGHRHC